MVKIHPKEDWIDPSDTPWDGINTTQGTPYYCPKRTNLSSAIEIVIHYPGNDWADMDFNNDGAVNLNDTIYTIRQGHRSYLRGSRGYSYGYCFIIGQEGEAWEARGLTYTNAANAGDADHNSKGWNSWSISIQIVVDVDQEANPKQITAANELIAYILTKAPNVKSLVWHGYRQYTSCCGQIINQIQRGLIHLPTGEPPIENPTEEEDMLRYILVPRPDPNTHQNWWPAGYDPAWIGVYDSGEKVRMTNGDMEYANSAGINQYGQTSKEQYNSTLVEFEIPYPQCP